ncbi:MAG: Y-family DNA polymerase [Chloroherpetonaceae bacterium]|nr:Y-family DNA polymerase [Chloroherpetonaceae bacterium]
MAAKVGLVDCNNFYVSCERVFQPHLRKKPVAVLSNNDGVVIARSNELKKLGIPAGAPYFKWKKQIEALNAYILSSNYLLYGDMSMRVMETIQYHAEEVEIYSIDEAFISITPEYGKTYREFGLKLKDAIQQWTGIPVSIGLSSTKTLAKIANHLAKKEEVHEGVCDLEEYDPERKCFSRLPIDEVWGFGRRITKRLNEQGMNTIADVLKKPESWVRKELHVTGLKTVKELKGTPCLTLEEVEPERKSMVHSRSFGRPITSFEEMTEAVSNYAERGAIKLRKAGLAPRMLTVFILTNRFNLNKPQYSNQCAVTLPTPTNFTPKLIDAALSGLKKIFKPGYDYQKAGILFTDLTPEDTLQQNLFDDVSEAELEKRQKLSQMVDDLNNRFGRNTISFAASGTKRSWRMKSDLLSPQFTTSWDELLVVKTAQSDVQSEENGQESGGENKDPLVGKK